MPATGESVVVEMQEATDEDNEPYYWGSFQPPIPGQQTEELDLTVTAEDATAHLERRTEPGSMLDSNPEMMATVDESALWDFPLRDYQPGADTNHTIRVAPRMEAEAVANDRFEEAAAIHCGISTTILESPDAVTMTDSLHNASDEDYYDVTFDVDVYDREVTNRRTQDLGAGLFVEILPPTIGIEIEETYGACVDVGIYDSTETVFREVPKADVVVIQNAATEFEDQSFYLVVRNHDFASQGPLSYSVKMEYRPVSGVVKGRLLYRFWEETPWGEREGIFVQGDPPESIVYQRPGDLISDLTQYIPHQLRALNIKGRREHY
ncbi:hypothetical protein [Halobellus litoreus]|nr:hypothetical protein [Halobellus litoreus]